MRGSFSIEVWRDWFKNPNTLWFRNGGFEEVLPEGGDKLILVGNHSFIRIDFPPSSTINIITQNLILGTRRGEFS